MRNPAIALAFLAVTAGCATSPAAHDDDSSSASMAACPMFPDGTPFDCSATIVTHPTATAPPEQGPDWHCIRHVEDTQDRGIFQIWRHEDGRFATYHEWMPPQRGWMGLVEIMIIYPAGGGQSVVLDYSPTAFVVWDEAPTEQRVQMHFRVRDFVLDRSTDGISWEQAEAVMVVGRFDVLPWYDTRFATPDGGAYLDWMKAMPPDADEGFLFYPDDRGFEYGGLEYLAVEHDAGYRYANEFVQYDPGRGVHCPLV